MTNRSILFLCSHGGAKSVMAAAYFNELAAARALPFTATAAAAEDPYAAVPEPVAELLERDGCDVRSFRPRAVVAEDVEGAAKVVAIGCDPASLAVDGELREERLERWDDVPQASEDLEGAAAAIRRRIAALAEELAGTTGSAGCSALRGTSSPPRPPRLPAAQRAWPFRFLPRRLLDGRR